MFEIYTDCEVFKSDRSVLLVTGDGKTLPGDLKAFLSWKIPHDVMCIGRSIQAYPWKVTHYADVDADAGKWVAENLQANNPDKGKPLTHTLGNVDWFDVGWEIENCPWPLDEVMWHGSTALFAVLVGLAMGYEKILLAGCPLDSKGHWYFEDGQETPGTPRWTAESYQAWFEFAIDPKSEKVFSLSGYTSQILGMGPVGRERFLNG